MQIKHQEQNNAKFRNLKISGISVKAFLNGLAGAGAENIDFSRSTLQVILTRAGQTTVICSSNLKILGLASCIDTLSQAAFADTVDTTVFLTSNTSSLLPFMIPFGGTIDLEGDDELYIEVVNNPGLFGNNALFASSYLEVKPIKSVGTERYVPQIRTFAIQANEQQNDYAMADNLIRLAVINFDQTSFLTNVINNINFGSEQLNETYTYADLIANKINRYGSQLIPQGQADLSVNIQQDQCFVLTDFHQDFDGCLLTILFNAANVTAANNYLVAWNYQTSIASLQKANGKDAAANKAKAGKIASSKK